MVHKMSRFKFPNLLSHPLGDDDGGNGITHTNLDGYGWTIDEGDDGVGGIYNSHGANDFDSLVAGSIVNIVGHGIASGGGGINAVDNDKVGRDDAVSIVRSNGPGIGVIRGGLMSDSSIPGQRDDRDGLIRIHRDNDRALDLQGLVAGGVRHVVGNFVFPGSLGIDSAGDGNLGGDVTIDNIRSSGTQFVVGGTSIHRDPGQTDEGNDRGGGVDHGHLAGKLGCLIAITVGNIVDHCIFSGLGSINSADLDNFSGKVPFHGVQGGGAGIGVGRTGLNIHLCLADQGKDRGGIIDHGHLAGGGGGVVIGISDSVSNSIDGGFGDIDRVVDRDLVGQVTIQGIGGGNPGIGIGCAAFMNNFSLPGQGDDRSGGVTDNDLAGGSGLVAGRVRGLIGHGVLGGLGCVDGVGDNNLVRDDTINDVGGGGPGIGIGGSSLYVDLGITDQGDDRCGGVDHRHLSGDLGGGIAPGIRYIEGHGVFAGLGSVDIAGRDGNEAGINVINNCGTAISVGGPGLNGDLGFTNQGDDRCTGVDHGDLAGDLGSLVAGGIGQVKCKCVNPELVDIDRVDDDHIVGNVPVQVVRGGEACIGVD